MKKSRNSRRVWGNGISNKSICKSQKGVEPGVRKGKRSMLACHTRRKCSRYTAYNFQASCIIFCEFEEENRRFLLIKSKIRDISWKGVQFRWYMCVWWGGGGGGAVNSNNTLHRKCYCSINVHCTIKKFIQTICTKDNVFGTSNVKWPYLFVDILDKSLFGLPIRV